MKRFGILSSMAAAFWPGLRPRGKGFHTVHKGEEAKTRARNRARNKAARLSRRINRGTL